MFDALRLLSKNQCVSGTRSVTPLSARKCGLLVDRSRETWLLTLLFSIKRKSMVFRRKVTKGKASAINLFHGP